MDAILICQITYSVVKLFEIKGKTRSVEPNEDILGYGLIFNQHEVLVDHANTIGDSIFGRIEADLLAVNKDLTRLGFVETGEHVHEGAFTCAVFSEKCVNFTGIEGEIDMVIR